MYKLPIVEALLSEEEDEYGSLVPLNRHGEKAAEIIEALVAALEFYEAPYEWLVAHEEDPICPDFWDELDFGSRARAALTKAKS